MAEHRPQSGGPDEGGRRPRQPAVHLLYRHGERRRLEDDRRRPDLEADLRRAADRIDRMRSRSRRRIRTCIYVGTGEGLPRPDLSVGDGVYKSTDAGKTWTHLGLRDAQQIPKIAIDPDEPEPPVRGRARPPLWPERGARHLPLDRRRPFVRARAVQGREHRRQGRRHRSVESRHRVRNDVGAAAGAVGERRLERHERRHLQVDRRRHDVEAADERVCPTASITRRIGDRAGEPAAAVRDRRRRRTAAPASTAPTTAARRGSAQPPTQRPTGRVNEAVPHVDPKERRHRSSSRTSSAGSRPTADRRSCRSRAPRRRRQPEHLV